MAIYDRTATGGGTAGHPANVARPYVVVSPVYDAADNTSLANGDIVKMIDLPADTVIVNGYLEILEAAGNANISLDVGVDGSVDTLIDGDAADAGISNFGSGTNGEVGDMVTAANAIQVKVIETTTTNDETALRFRVIAVLADVSQNPVESATVSTGT